MELDFELTESERKVYDALITTGASNRDLSKNLNLAHNTIKGILKNIYSKLNVSGARELIVKHYKGI